MHKLDSARHAGNIIRYHSWPTLQQQTNAHHTWNVMRIYSELFGWPIAEVAAYIHYHDVGELDTGDISFVVKRNHPGIKKITKPIEAAAMKRLSRGYATEDMISNQEKIKVKICDLLEMLEFSLDEIFLGNHYYGWLVFENIFEALMEVIPDFMYDDAKVIARTMKEAAEGAIK